MSYILFLCCLACFVFCDEASCAEKPLKRENVFVKKEDPEVTEIHNLLKQDNPQNDDEIRAAFPVMDAFKSHQLFSPEDLNDKREYENADEANIEKAVEAALRKLRKKKGYVDDAVKQNTAALNADDGQDHFEDKHKKKNVTAKELIDEVVKDEIKSHGGSSEEENDDDGADSGEDSKASSRSSFDDNQIHKKLAEIALLEKKLAHLVRQVKHYLRKKKAQGRHKSGELEDNDDVESILAEADDKKKKKRSGIPHTSVLEKFRKNPDLVDKYMDNILSDDSDTANGDQRDLLGKKEMETALLRDVVPGEINSIPLSRLDKESDDYESMTTDRGIARDAMVESPFSMLDVKKTTGKKFRHDVS